MDLAWISLIALLITIVVSCTTAVNPGVLAIVFAWLIGVYVAPLCGQEIGLKTVVAGFPADLLVTLVGVTLLFAQAQVNGTLDRVAARAVRGCRGNTGLIPIMFFGLALSIASIGAGNIAAAALVGPTAMAVAARAGISPFLMTIMVAHGAVAGALSPFSPTGIIAAKLMTNMDLQGNEWPIFGYNLLSNSLAAFAGYFLFGGVRLFRRRFADDLPGPAQSPSLDLANDANASTTERAESIRLQAGMSDARSAADAQSDNSASFEVRHWVTLGLVALLVFGVLCFGVDVGLGAFAAAVVLTLLRMADERRAVQAMPWSVMLMVCGVTVLTALLNRTGGLDRLTTLVSSVSTLRSITGFIALVSGIVSVYSSTSGVVLPAFLPMTPGLVEQLGGSDALAISSSIIVGGHLVDVSPLSTIGALCIASVAAGEDRRVLFNKVLAWGLLMAPLGSVFCYLCFGLR